MQKLLPYLVLVTGLALSTVAAYFSIIGLTVIFSSPESYWPVVIMAGTLEVAKLVSISWLYHNWYDSPKSVKTYFVSSIVILMLITSMGIFGFLSKSHIDQQLKMDTGVQTEIQSLENKIKDRQKRIEDLDKQIGVIDSSIDVLIKKGQAEKSLKQSKTESTTRNQLVSRRDIEEKEIAELREKAIRIKAEQKKLEAEVGPVKYIAELFYDTTDEKLLEKAVKLVIIIFIVVFDPLAIFLLIAFNISMRKKEEGNMEFIEIPKSFLEPKKRKKKTT